MEKKIGLDLGTNSIGWAIRNTLIDDPNISQIEKFGVVVFPKGVGEGKSGEYSYAAERTKKRSGRRLYQVRKYRLWATLEILIKEGYCPLSIEELDGWRKYDKEKKREYPQNEIFEQWIRLDFNNDSKPEYDSPYHLRALAIEKELTKYEIGRALYHIAQRRGFKSSRKTGTNEETAVYKGSSKSGAKGVDEIMELIEKEGTLGAALHSIQSNGERIRNRYTLRKHYKDEVGKICEKQNVDEETFKKIDNAIFYQRPLRSQKGLVGKCTLEPKKPRCPISHPDFEEFRARTFINNIRYKLEDSNQWVRIDNQIIEEIFLEKFLRQKPDFNFDEIKKFLEKRGIQGRLNYKDFTAVSGCPVSARLKNIFGEEWRNIKITYKDKTYTNEDLWHVLFSFEDEECVVEFAIVNLGLNEDKTKAFVAAWNQLPDGYSMISLNAIRKILPFLREGLIYTDAVILSNIPFVIGNEIWAENRELITKEIREIVEKNREEKKIINIANILISQYYALAYEERFGWKNKEYVLDEADKKQVLETIVEVWGEKSWKELTEGYRKSIFQQVTGLYQQFFKSSERKHFTMPKLIDSISGFLSDNFNCILVPQKNLYHPSQIEIYPKVKESDEDGKCYLPSPKIGSFKNPMAMRTLHELRKLLNHLIKTDQIDQNTHVIVEVARQLNDANKRWAIETYQRQRQSENQEFAKAIIELNKNGYPNISPENPENIDKFRLWFEQIENSGEVLDEVKKLKTDIEKYRLWKDQNCQCMYTGKVIKISDLFNENVVDFEHTIPRSKSFDNSLENLTVCYADYNRSVKRNKIPTELSNYDKDNEHGNAIVPRLKMWEEKVKQLEKNIENTKKRSRAAMDKDQKDSAIRQKHLYQFELDYWRKKLERFTIKEITSGFKNSQLVDTHIISKYAFHYLKSVFERVDVQKGSVTAEFRKIYEIQPDDEKKYRGKHSHHAIDAATLTLIPTSAKRDIILQKAYTFNEETGKKYHEKPYPFFNIEHIQRIDDIIVVNNVSKNQTFTPSKRVVRKRGRIIYLRDSEGRLLRDSDGNPKPKIAQGDSIRGELHMDSFYGKIKVAKRDSEGKPLVEDGKFVFEEKNDGFKFVIRRPIDDLKDLKNIVDPHLKKIVESQLNGRSLSQAISDGLWMYDKKGNKVNRIRHVRCFANDVTDPLQIKKQTHISTKTSKHLDNQEHKHFYWAKNASNALYGFYQNKDRTLRGFEMLNLMQVTQIRKTINVSKEEDYFEPQKLVGRGNNKVAIPLYAVFKAGQRVLFYKETPEELKQLDYDELRKRLYYIMVLFDKDFGRIKFQYHLESRNDNELTEAYPVETFGKSGKNGFSSFDWDFTKPRLLLSLGNFNFIVEGRDFQIFPDGVIDIF
ncbi:MAG TPA: HNH endonuclease domain-containing protein [Tenuifilaceae bacterium]|nr:HNH endonuclease domain-containing protein [Tenuifilaceae bacterium]HPQ35530.1 HNH endonuclease domain-containing protein [Tenuifilaceae bacterium]